jgi:hypothetical protein
MKKLNVKGVVAVALVFQIIFGIVGVACIAKIPERSKARAEAKKDSEKTVSGNGGYVVNNK